MTANGQKGMGGFAVQVAPWMDETLRSIFTHHEDEQQATDSVVKVLEAHAINYTVREEDGRKVFLSEHGGELAVIVQG